jgi:hypothetical protein
MIRHLLVALFRRQPKLLQCSALKRRLNREFFLFSCCGARIFYLQLQLLSLDFALGQRGLPGNENIHSSFSARD